MKPPANRAALSIVLALALVCPCPSPTHGAEDPAPIDAELRKELDSFLVSLREAYRSGVAELYLQNVDTARMTREIARICNLSPLRVIGIGLRKQLENLLPTHFELAREFLIWEEHRILEIVRLSATEVRVAARLIDADGISTRHAWWIVRGDDRWRLYDFEDLGAVARLSDAFRASFDLGVRTTELLPALRRLNEAVAQVAAQDFWAAQAELDEIPTDLPAFFEAQRGALAASVAIALGNPLDALSQCDRVDATGREAPIVHYLRARALVDLERGEEALVAIDANERALGRDADTCSVRGDALRSLDRIEEALAAYREGLRDTSASSSCLAGLAMALDETGHEELVRALRAPKTPAVLFESVCEELLGQFELPALERIITAFRDIDPESADIDFYSAGVHSIREEHEKAAPLYLRGMKRTDEAQRELFLERYLDEMIALEKPVEGYENVTDVEFAFEYLADWYADELEILESLVIAHRKRAPRDPLLFAWQAQIHYEREEYETVVESLRGKLDPEGEIDIYWIESLLFRSLLRTKRSEEALTVAKASTARDDDPSYEVIAHALRGDVKETIAAVARCIEEQEYTAEFFYEDEDAGEILRTSEAFAPLRARWPLEADAAPDDDAPPPVPQDPREI